MSNSFKNIGSENLKPWKGFEVGSRFGHFFFGRGKLMLTGEYLTMKGGMSLALPTTLGQSLSIKTKKSFSSPTLEWTSIDYSGKVWFETIINLSSFEIESTTSPEKAELLVKILQAIRKLNIHFLRENFVYQAQTNLDFPNDWGLGSSSTLICNMAKWGIVDPFALSSLVLGGSGYDIACAMSDGPLIYQCADDTPSWKNVDFKPTFSDKLFFVHSKQKVLTHQEIDRFKSLSKTDEESSEALKTINKLTVSLLNSQNDHVEFLNLLDEHEQILSEYLGYSCLKDKLFKDFKGSIKSLGAWGGDFFLASSKDLSQEQVKDYFHKLGFETIINYKDIISDGEMNTRFNKLSH